ncbi:hypothetical protein BJ322DRAFT_1161494 [Thelephora terrestris]|uniref:Uncharacterized protein n=1 Tax=Thelephora terrestris TaxID=56493 RepID=A0A9P6L413_9AGAM|nr:hypothetical protein BJ322DRAFT_1161494 [Thelephora terrestris]
MFHYALNGSAPRPESYLEDYQTATGVNLTEQQRSDLYAELSTGPESGNALTRLDKSHQILAGYLDKPPRHRFDPCAGVLDFFLDSNKLAFDHYDLTSNARENLCSTTTFYSFWDDGTFLPGVLETGLQRDTPNAWPLRQYIALEALRNFPHNLSTNAVPNGKTFDLMLSRQLGVTKDQLPSQPIGEGGDMKTREDTSKSDRTVTNGGTAVYGEVWGPTLQRSLANRYTTAAFYSWWATGGLSNVLPKRSGQDLNLMGSLNSTGNVRFMFTVFIIFLLAQFAPVC